MHEHFMKGVGGVGNVDPSHRAHRMTAAPLRRCLQKQFPIIIMQEEEALTFRFHTLLVVERWKRGEDAGAQKKKVCTCMCMFVILRTSV